MNDTLANTPQQPPRRFGDGSVGRVPPGNFRALISTAFALTALAAGIAVAPTTSVDGGGVPPLDEVQFTRVNPGGDPARAAFVVSVPARGRYLIEVGDYLVASTPRPERSVQLTFAMFGQGNHGRTVRLGCNGPGGNPSAPLRCPVLITQAVWLGAPGAHIFYLAIAEELPRTGLQLEDVRYVVRFVGE